MKVSLALPLSMFCPFLFAAQEIETREVTYQGGTVESKGYLAMPKGEGPHPGVIVLHEWWGCNDYVKKRAEMLAELGYAALAADLYGEGQIAHSPKEGWTMLNPVLSNSGEMTARVKGAIDLLKSLERVDGEKIAAVGYSFGGTVALQMARNGMPGLDGVAAFHPVPLRVREPNPPIDKVTAKILVCNATEGIFALPRMVEAFKKEMSSVKADMKFVEYGTAMDSFTNPDATKLGKKHRVDLVYNAEADAASWKELQEFLEALWKEEPAEG